MPGPIDWDNKADKDGEAGKDGETGKDGKAGKDGEAGKKEDKETVIQIINQPKNDNKEPESNENSGKINPVNTDESDEMPGPVDRIDD